MKKIKYMILFLIVLLVTITKANAACTDSEYFNYQQLAIPISITYKESDTLLDSQNNPIKGVYSLIITGLSDELYLYNENNKFKITTDLQEEEGIITINGLEGGEYIFEVKNDNCNKSIKQIKVTLPKYNLFANKEECKDIDPNDFALCSKWYPYEITEDDFQRRLIQYKNSLNKKEEVKEETIEEQITNYVNANKKVILIITLSLILLIIIIIILKRRRNTLKYQVDLSKLSKK